MEDVIEIALGKDALAKARADLALLKQKRAAESTIPAASA
jgi:hypothetical protein